MKQHLSEDADEGMSALVLHEDGQTLFKRESSLVSDQLQWNRKENFDHNESPSLNFTEARLEAHHNSANNLQAAVMYAETVTAVSPTEEKTGESSVQGYVTKFSDGKRIPADGIHTTQVMNMVESVCYLIEEHNLHQKISLPHTPSWANKNCSLNDEPVHPNGEKMQNFEEMPGGLYLFTHLNESDKQSRVKDLAKGLGKSVEDFLGQWETDN